MINVLHQIPRGEPGSSGLLNFISGQGLSESTENRNGRSHYFKLYKIEIFWLNCYLSKDDVIDDGKFRYYRNIYWFIARIKIIIFIRDIVIIRQNLDMYFKEEGED
jgi:hypothetical protein